MYYYKQVTAGNVVSVEAKSVDKLSPGFVKTTKVEYDGFIASLPIPIPKPVRDLGAEIDKLKADVKELIHIIARLR